MLCVTIATGYFSISCWCSETELLAVDDGSLQLNKKQSLVLGSLMS